MGVKEYRVFVKIDDAVYYKSQPQTLVIACKMLLDRLQAINALSCYDAGEFITTTNPFTKENVVKRYTITTIVPRETIIIHKRTKGDMNKHELLSMLKYLKERYFEGV